MPIVGPKYKICRRLGSDIYEKCQTGRFSVSQARKEKTSNRRPKGLTEYGQQLIEKQKVKFSYGLTEKQFSKYVKEAISIKGMSPADKLFEKLESRLDNIAYRLGLAKTRAAARQMVSHGHITVNDRKVTIPSYEVRPGDVIRIREGSKSKNLFSNFIERIKDYKWPSWLKFDPGKFEAEVVKKPTKDKDAVLGFEAIFEFYSR